jgi:hypothetical protein
MQGTGKWIAGAAIGLVGVLGLFMSANARDTTFYYLGLAVFVLAVLIIGAIVKRHYDVQENAQG